MRLTGETDKEQTQEREELPEGLPEIIRKVQLPRNKRPDEWNPLEGIELTLDENNRLGLYEAYDRMLRKRSWIDCKVKKAYKSQEKLISEGKYCALSPELAEELGVSEGYRVEIRRAHTREKSAVYVVDEVREQKAQIRTGSKGRKRINASGPFEAEIASVDPA